MAVIRFGRQCDTLQESCCMTIVMDNFVEWMLRSFQSVSSFVVFFFFLFVFIALCILCGAAIENCKQNRTKEWGEWKKKCIHHLMQFTPCNWRLLTRCLHAVDNVTVKLMWLLPKGNRGTDRPTDRVSDYFGAETFQQQIE